MTAQHDPTVPIGPLSQELIASLTEARGEPQPHMLTISEGKDIRALGWIIGHGGVSGSSDRGTDVEIIALKSGNIVTTRMAWSAKILEVSPGRREWRREVYAATGRVNSTPQAAYQWLLDDGDGRLGPASKAAWVDACRNFPPMNAFEYEEVE